MDSMFSETLSLMLCTCCLLMLSRIILRDGLLRVIWTKRISTLICQKCCGLLVINDIMFSTTYNYLVRKSVKWSTFQARITSHFGGTGKSFNYNSVNVNATVFERKKKSIYHYETLTCAGEVVCY